MAKTSKYAWLQFQGGVDWRHVNPYLLTQINALGRKLKKIITVTSGYRTRAEQERLYQRYVKSGYNRRYIAAKPGQSNHESGRAVDATIGGVAVGSAVSAKLLSAFGLGAPVKGDPVHLELVGSAAQAAQSAAPSAAPAQAQPTGPAEGAAVTFPDYSGALPTSTGLREPTNLPPGSVPATGFDPRILAETWQLIGSDPSGPNTSTYASIVR